MTARLTEVVSRFRQAARGWSRSTGAPHAEEESERQACPGLRRALDRVLRAEGKSQILDLGPLCGPTAVFLADLGARVSVAEFVPPEPPVEPADGEAKPVPPPLALPHADAKFHLVLAWEHLDFLPPERLGEFAGELRRVMAPGGWLVLFSRDRSGGDGSPRPERPSTYRLVAEDAVVRQPAAREPRARWVHPTRTLERALSPLTIQGVHLQRDRTREFLAFKPAR